MNKVSTKMVWILLVMGLVGLPSMAYSAGPEDNVPEQLRVGAIHMPPFIMQNSSDEWGGLSFDLVYAVARELGSVLEVVPVDSIEQMETDLIGEKLHLVPVAIVTERLERKLDFSNAYYQSGSAIVIHADGSGHTVMSFVKAMLSLFFPRVAGLLILMWLVAGLVVWLFEKKHNHEMFGKRLLYGLGHGIWWAAVTMTTVGYGDKAPKTIGGRVVAVIWMFTSIILISIFTATVTTSLTMEQLNGKVRGLRDLPHVRVGSLEGAQQVSYLAKTGIRAMTYESVADGLQAVSENELDAFVYDVAVLKYFVKELNFENLYVLPELFNKHYVSMILPEGSTLREPLNRALQKVTEKDQWKDLLNIYLGASP